MCAARSPRGLEPWIDRGTGVLYSEETRDGTLYRQGLRTSTEVGALYKKINMANG